jgi:hypothetical protein
MLALLDAITWVPSILWTRRGGEHLIGAMSISSGRTGADCYSRSAGSGASGLLLGDRVFRQTSYSESYMLVLHLSLSMNGKKAVKAWSYSESRSGQAGWSRSR